MSAAGDPTASRTAAAPSVSAVAGQRILVTGGNGFLGCHAAVAARQSGADVLVVDLPGTTVWAERIRASLGGKGVAAREVSQLDAQALRDLLTGFCPQVVLHLAGVTRRDATPEALAQCAAGNVDVTVAVLAAMTDLPDGLRPALVMPGSQMEYGLAPMPWTERQAGMPANPYGASKLAATELVLTAVRTRQARACVARLALVFGPAQAPTMIVPELIIKALRGMAFRMTSGEQRRRFVRAADVARCLLELGGRLAAGKHVPPLVNALACEPIRVVDLAQRLAACIGDKVVLQVGALPQRGGELPEAWPDTALAESLGLPAVAPLDEALAATVAWYRANPWFTESFEPPP